MKLSGDSNEGNTKDKDTHRADEKNIRHNKGLTYAVMDTRATIISIQTKKYRTLVRLSV